MLTLVDLNRCDMVYMVLIRWGMVYMVELNGRAYYVVLQMRIIRIIYNKQRRCSIQLICADSSLNEVIHLV